MTSQEQSPRSIVCEARPPSAYRAIDPADGSRFRWRDSRPYHERRIPVCMCDDDDDRAAGTAEVTRGGGCSPGTERRYRGSRKDVEPSDEGGRKIARRSGGIARPRALVPGGLAVVGPMEHDALTRLVMPRVVGTLASPRPLLAALTMMLLVALLSSCARASEFPERECCDLIFPIPEPTGRSTSAPTPTGRSGELFAEIVG